ncbi:MAG: gliding motility-associated C-terminal domain-containing protein [Bacteroidetes bacterium]|nr:gliding motility-associated C-terminal domain-containing protein [Bacteroidota bacterium]
MRKVLFTTLFILGASCSYIRTFANHVFGGELLYQHITGNTYALTLTLYGDCGAPNQSVFQGLYTSTPLVYVFHDNYQDSVHLYLQPVPNIGVEVSPVCPSQINNTTCRGGTLPGVTKFVYVDTVTLPRTSDNWHFLFFGALNDSSGAGRSHSITNVGNAGGTYVYLEAVLNNVLAPNSSPQYTTIPTPFYTVNTPQQYNQGAVDGDNDSLSFSLVEAIDGASGSPVSYVPPLTASAPLLTDSAAFLFNSINGQLSFTPNMLQDALVVNKVTEYRNGQFVGSSVREMTFVVLDNLVQDHVQHTEAVNINGGYSSGNNVVNICKGASSVDFDIAPVDTAGNAVIVSYTPLPAGATLNLQNNNTTSPHLHFSWNTVSVATGIYNFFVNYKINSCPISTTQTIAYTVNVVNPYEVVAVSQTATHCYYNATVTVIIKNGALPATISVSKNNIPLTSVAGNSDTIALQLPAGNYTGVVSAPGLSGCSAPFAFSVVDSGAYPFGPSLGTVHDYCINDSATLLIATPDSGAVVQWYNTNGDSLPSAPIPPTDSVGVHTWYVTEQIGPCLSEKEEVTVHVYDKPPITILSEQGTVCIGEIIYLEATGGKNYDWEPVSRINTDRNGRQYIRVFEPVEYTLYAQSEFGCKDSLKLRYDKVNPCCQFSYPDAFTPNGDGKNDRFKALVIGNMQAYELDIFDRWGRRLFWNNDPGAAWDGTFRGKECNADVYFYRVHARCYTGHEEDITGTVTLLR